MQVILVKPVRKLGQVGETVTVANGYGRNYLVPQEFAIRATKENRNPFKNHKPKCLLFSYATNAENDPNITP